VRVTFSSWSSPAYLGEPTAPGGPPPEINLVSKFG
jgi:hypothetical protein